jgi:hypothetical protein
MHVNMEMIAPRYVCTVVLTWTWQCIKHIFFACISTMYICTSICKSIYVNMYRLKKHDDYYQSNSYAKHKAPNDHNRQVRC